MFYNFNKKRGVEKQKIKKGLSTEKIYFKRDYTLIREMMNTDTGQIVEMLIIRAWSGGLKRKKKITHWKRLHCILKHNSNKTKAN